MLQGCKNTFNLYKARVHLCPFHAGYDFDCDPSPFDFSTDNFLREAGKFSDPSAPQFRT